jgi:hypothetical protein
MKAKAEEFTKNEPFSGFESFSNEELKSLWEYLNISKQYSSEFKVIKSIPNEKTFFVYIEKKNKIKQLNIIKGPVTLQIDDLRPITIYSVNQIHNILQKLEEFNYDIVIDDKNKDEYKRNFCIETIQKIKACNKEIIEYNNFIKYIYRINKNEDKKIDKEILFNKDKDFNIDNNNPDNKYEILNIDKEKLSFFFDKICIYDKSEQKFNLILDNYRINLTKKFDDFFF